MNTSVLAPGDRPPPAGTSRPLVDRDRVRAKIGVVADCLQRILDVLALERLDETNRGYLLAQTCTAELAIHDLYVAVGSFKGQDDDDDDLVDTPLCPGDKPCCLPFESNGPYEGRGA